MRALLDTAEIRIESWLSETEDRSLANDVLDGLTRPFKELPPKHFYDTRGSELFEQICELPEYYPTRTEREILERRADEIVSETGAGELVELGSGSAEKARILLDAMAGAGTLRRYVPFDVSEQVVRDAAAAARRRVRRPARPRRHRRLRAPPRPRPAERRRAAARRPARRHDRQLPAGHAPADAAQDRRPARPRGSPAARHRPGQGPGRDRGRLRRPPGRHRRVQPQRPARDQPRARRRLRARRVRAHRVLRPPARVDRDAAARAAAVHRADRRPRAAGRVRPRRGAAHRDQREVHTRACARRLRGRGTVAARLVHRPERPVRAVARCPRP